MKKSISIWTDLPTDFIPKLEVVSSYLSFNSRFLLLKRHPKCSQGNRWCLPGGKLEKGEEPSMGILREVQEEVNVDLSSLKVLSLGQLYIRRDNFDYILHMFYTCFPTVPFLKLKLDEHTQARWISIKEAPKFPLIRGGLQTLRHYTSRIQSL